MMRTRKINLLILGRVSDDGCFFDCISDFQGLLASGNVLIGNCEENRTKGANGCTR